MAGSLPPLIIYTMPEPINVFIIYAREDKEIKQGLLRHLNPLKDSYNLSIWHDDHIDPGQEWKPSIESRLEKTDLFVMLVSADFMNSEFIHQVEFKFAIDRHKQNKAIVIPVIIDYCLWDIDITYKEQTFNLKDLQVLPDEAKPIGEWKTPEQAYNNIAGGIRKVLLTIKEKPRQPAGADAGIQLATQSHEEIIREQRTKKNREENLQRQIAEQKEKELLLATIVDLPPEDESKGGSTKKIIYLFIIVVAVFVLAYFMFHNTDKKISGENEPGNTATMITPDSLKENNIDMPTTTGNEGKSKQPAVNPAPPVGDFGAAAKAGIKSFNTFPYALAAAIKDAPNNFANVRGTYAGMEDGMKKYKALLPISDRAFKPSYLFQNGSEWKFVFVNENNGNYQSIKSSIVSLLKKNNINFAYESSASMGFEKYTWNNEAFEINLSIRKYTDNFVEVALYHRG